MTRPEIRTALITILAELDREMARDRDAVARHRARRRFAVEQLPRLAEFELFEDLEEAS